jgi:hypothetical protein
MEVVALSPPSHTSASRLDVVTAARLAKTRAHRDDHRHRDDDEHAREAKAARGFDGGARHWPLRRADAHEETLLKLILLSRAVRGREI